MSRGPARSALGFGRVSRERAEENVQHAVRVFGMGRAERGRSPDFLADRGEAQGAHAVAGFLKALADDRVLKRFEAVLPAARKRVKIAAVCVGGAVQQDAPLVQDDRLGGAADEFSHGARLLFALCKPELLCRQAMPAHISPVSAL